MENDILKKLDSLSRHNRFVEKFQPLISPFLSAVLIFTAVSFFITLHAAFWYALPAAAVIVPLLIYISAAFKKIEKKDHYRKIDEVLDMKERAVTHYEAASRPDIAPDDEIAAIARKDFYEKLSASAGDILKNDTVFNDTFQKKGAHLTSFHRRLVFVCLILAAVNFYINYQAGQVRSKPAKTQSAEKKEIKKDAAEIVDKIIDAKEKNITSLPDALAELKKVQQKLKDPLTEKELAGALKDASDKLKNIQNEKNSKGVADELSKIESEVNNALTGKEGENPFSADDKKMAQEKIASLKKMVDDYLKSSNDKNFKKIEKEISDLSAMLEAKKEAIKKSMADSPSTDGRDGTPKGGQGKPLNADQKSTLKQMSRMSGKELLEKLKTDKALQELYAGLNAMSEEAESQSSKDQQNAKDGEDAQNSKGEEGDGQKASGEGKDGAGKEGKEGAGGKEGKNGQGGDGKGKGKGKGSGKITAESLGISVPKAGVGSSNLREEGQDAPLMVPQSRESSGKKPVKSGQWEALFAGERQDVKTEKTKVEGINDTKVGTMTIEGKSLPAPGEAHAEVTGFIKSESGSVDSFVSSEAVPDELKRSVSDYFKKLNNDYDSKSGGKNAGK